MLGRLLAVGLAVFSVTASAETQLQRSEYLVRVVAACGNCHTPIAPKGPEMGQELAGRLVEKNPYFTAYAPNITQDKETGFGNASGLSIANFAFAVLGAVLLLASRRLIKNAGKLYRAQSRRSGKKARLEAITP